MNKEALKNIFYQRLLFLVIVSLAIFSIVYLTDENLTNKLNLKGGFSPEKNLLTGYAVSDFDDSLRSYYPFNITIAYNDAKDTNNLACVSSTCPVLINEGKFDNAISFDGTNDVLTKIGDANGFNRNQFTFAAWIKVDSSKDSERRVIIDVTRDNGKRRALMIAGNTQNGKPVLHYGDQKGRYANTPDLRDGAWHHVAYSINDDNTEVKFYLDGVQQTLTAEESGASLGTPASISVGKSLVNGKTEYFKGVIDELRIYNRPLTQSEISEVYNYVPPNPSPQTDDLRCVDSDFGPNNYTLKGSTNKTLNSVLQNSSLDFCGQDGKLRDFYCSSTNDTQVMVYSCPLGQVCSGGSCQTAPACTPLTLGADCGNKSSSIICYDNNTVEGLFNKTITPSCDNNACNMSNVTYKLVSDCDYGCDYDSDSCFSQPQEPDEICMDSDSLILGLGAVAGGLYEKGNVSFYNESSNNLTFYLDSCFNTTVLTEYRCSEAGKVFAVNYTCPQGCSLEQCSGNPVESCEDSDGGREYEEPGEVNYTLDGISYYFTDQCRSNNIFELYCDGDNANYRLKSCGATMICDMEPGSCIPLNTNSSSNNSSSNVNLVSQNQCTDGQWKCEGTSYIYCANGVWLSPQKIPGSCGYQTNVNEVNPGDIGPSIGQQAKERSENLFTALIILMICIIIILSVVIGYIIYRRRKAAKIKEDNMKKSMQNNNKPGYSFSSQNQRR